MPFPPRLPARIQDFVAGAKAALDSFFRRVADIAEILREKAWLIFDRVQEKLPPKKRRMVLIGLMGGIVIILFILIGSIISRKKPETGIIAPMKEVSQPGFIPPDEVFLPDEPDFVPGLILDREQRTSWTAEDAGPLWQDPLKDGEEPWRNQIEKSIDTLMESVP